MPDLYFQAGNESENLVLIPYHWGGLNIMDRQKPPRMIIQREHINTTPRCPACGRQFTMGESAVFALMADRDTPCLVHAEDAVFDQTSGCYVVKDK